MSTSPVAVHVLDARPFVGDDATVEQRRTLTLAELERGLEAVPARLAADPGVWVVAIHLPAHPGFVQALASGGRVYAEVSENAYLAGEWALSEEQVDRLRGLGWSEPDDRRPNWRRDVQGAEEVAKTADMAMAALREVFGALDGETVSVRLFRSPMDEHS